MAAALVVMPAALAAEEEPAVLPLEPVFAEPVLEQQAGAMLFSEPVWDGSHSSYRDQLTKEEKEVYDKIVKVFNAFAQDMKGYVQNQDCPLELRPVQFEGENKKPYERLCWVIDSAIKETWRFEGLYADPSYFEHFYTARNIFQKAGSAIALDHPEFFWIRESCSISMGEYSISECLGGTGTEDDPYIFEMTASFDMVFLAYPTSDTVEECDVLQDALNKVIEQILTTVSSEEYSTIEKKLEYVDNWLAEHNRYNSDAAKENTWIYRDETPWSVVGGLLDGYSPVCEGYAKAFQLLCHELGLPCLQVSGYAYQLDEDGNVNYKSGGAHMWTVVRLNGTWYFCDPTWNDPLFKKGNETYDKDFSSREYLLTDQPAGHFAQMQFTIPECGTNYFSFDAADVDWIIANLDVNSNYEDSDTWERTDDSISGYEVGKGTMMVALYDDGRMLGIVECEVAYEDWRGSGWNVYSISGIDPEMLAQADEIVRFNTDTTYAPIGAVREID